MSHVITLHTRPECGSGSIMTDGIRYRNYAITSMVGVPGSLVAMVPPLSPLPSPSPLPSNTKKVHNRHSLPRPKAHPKHLHPPLRHLPLPLHHLHGGHLPANLRLSGILLSEHHVRLPLHLHPRALPGARAWYWRRASQLHQ